MSDDDEVLPLGNDLSRHMISEGFIDFETYNQYMPHGSARYTKTDSSSVLAANNLDCKTTKTTYITPHDHNKLMNLLNSKLLLPEDFELLEFFISRTATSKCQANYLWAYSGSVIVSTLSLALYFSKRISFHLPAALISTLSFLSLRHCCNYLQGISENRSFISAIGSLQRLCLSVNKSLRLLKETEILSTGQVTTHNVGAALYIPVRSLAEQGTLPSWKTLPHLRKCLANTLLDIIALLKSTCAEARKLVPDWLYIEGYTLTNECSLPDPLTADSLCRTDDYISLKELQLLNDSYLILQSELLRWIGICICPSAWNTSDSNYKSSRIQILKLFYSFQSKLSDISFKLKMNFDIQNIFIEGKQLVNQRLNTSDVTEINNVQSELHNLYLLILSMLINLKSLEDQLESNSNSVNNTGLSNLRENLNQQLKNVRDELISAVKMFDTICLHSFSNQKSGPVQSDKLDEENCDNTISKSHTSPPGENTSQSDCQINSLDEVFLAVTYFDPNEQEKQGDNWDFESKPPIPNTLLAELSTTLKPIKENFKEREKAALERAGLEDINNESDSASEITDENSLTNSFARPLPRIKKKRKTSKLERTNYGPLSNRNEDSESDSSILSMEDSVNTHVKMNSVQNTSFLREDPSMILPVHSDKSIANMIAMKSQTWGLAEEEHYSDD